MHNTSTVLLRNATFFENSRSLILGVSDAALAGQWPGELALWVSSKADADELEMAGHQVVFGAVQNEPVACEQIVIVLPKSRELLNCWLAQLGALYAGKPVYLVGEKKQGIQGAAKQLKEFCGDVVKLDVARHCQLWKGELNEAGAFSLEQWYRRFEVPVSGQESLSLVSIPGVFNHGELDDGTALLLENMGKLPEGRILDFGCGAGVLGLSIKRLQAAAEVEMLDVSAEAVSASRLSAEENGLQVKVFASNGMKEVQGKYAAIYSNPPFHTGVNTDYSIAQRFFMGAGDHLLPGGELRIVANAFLKYPELIERYIGPCRVIAENKRFKVYSARRGVTRR